MSDEILPHEKEVRARLLPHNQWFTDDIGVIREKLGIPKDGFTSIGDGLRWWLSHTEQHAAGDFTCSQCGKHYSEQIIHCGQEVVRQWYQGNLDDPQR